MHGMEKTSGVKLEKVVWEQIVKGLECHNSWSLRFVPQATGSPQRLQEIRDVVIFIFLVSDFGYQCKGCIGKESRIPVKRQMLMAQLRQKNQVIESIHETESYEGQKGNLEKINGLKFEPETKWVPLTKKAFIGGEIFSMFCVRNI